MEDLLQLIKIIQNDYEDMILLTLFSDGSGHINNDDNLSTFIEDWDTSEELNEILNKYSIKPLGL